MNHDELLRSFREATQSAPLGARARVWASISTPRRSSRSAFAVVSVAAVAVAVAVGVVAWLNRPADPFEWSDEYSVVAWQKADASFDVQARKLQLTHGEVAISAWAEPLSVVALGHEVRVERGLALVRVAADTVEVEPLDGVVWFDSRAMEANRQRGDSASSLGEVVRALERPAARSSRLLTRAEQAISQGDFEVATASFDQVVALGSLEAEIALYRKGEVELHELNRPQAALRTFVEGEQRFARGALAQERQLSAIESCVRLELWDELVARTATFVEQFPRSERLEEVQGVRAMALHTLGRDAEACAASAQLPESVKRTLEMNCR